MVSLRKILETAKKPSSPTKQAKSVSSGSQKKPERSNKRKKHVLHFKAEDAVMNNAKEIEENLPDKFPKFVKPFTPSYDSLGCLRLPIEFCKDHILDVYGKGQTAVTLVNEAGEEYNMNLILEPRRKELNGGWTMFSAKNKLCVGDVLVFQLIEPLKFKVYVVRAKDFAGKNGTRDSKKLRFTKCPDEDRPLAHLRESARNKKKTPKAFSLEDAVLERATKVMASLPTKFPNCLQTVTASYIQRGCLRLPEQFCHFHLLGDEGLVTMVDESDREYKINYLKNRRELGSGWRQFSKDNKLCVGDVLIFQLTGHFRMKVCTVRAHGPDGVDSTHGFGSCIKQTDSSELPIVTVAEHSLKGSVEKVVSGSDIGDSQFEKDSEECALDSDDGHIGFPGFPRPAVDFQEVKSVEDFSIVINGMNIDSEVSEQDRAKYYKLCCSQESYLHDHLLEDINTRQWAATIVSKTVKIADAIKGCQFSTPRSDYESWDKILNSFELLGLNVGFLRVRLKRLMRLAFESEGAEICRRQVETRQAVLKAEENIRSLESDIQMLEEKKRKLELFREKKEELVDEINERSSIAKKYEDSFQEEVDAEW